MNTNVTTEEFIKEMKKFRTPLEYQYAKKLLKERADFMEKEYPSDKHLQRVVISNFCEWLCKNYSFTAYKCNLLSEYAHKLQP